MSRPATGAAALQMSGSKPPTAAPGSSGRLATGTVPKTGSPRTATGLRTGSKGLNAGLSLLGSELIKKLRLKFGDAAADIRGQEIISQEVMAFMASGKIAKIEEEDLSALETRIRARLTGSTPITNTLAMDKRAQIEGDEWAKMYQFSILEGMANDKIEAQQRAEARRKLREVLERQVKEKEDAKKHEHDEDMAYAAQEKSALKHWEASEMQRRKLAQDIAARLKAEQADQLTDKMSRRAEAFSKQRAYEDKLTATMAYQTKAEMEKEEVQRQTAKAALNFFIKEAEQVKVYKEEKKLLQWEEDAAYQKAWQAQLDKQERERTERLQATKVRADARAANLQGKVPEDYKRWIDPAIIDKNQREYNEKKEREENEKRARLKAAEIATFHKLGEQIKEKEEIKQMVRSQDEEKAKIVLARARAAEEEEQRKREAREAAKLQFRAQLQRQMKANVDTRRNQPMSETERQLNRNMLEKVKEFQTTGRINGVDLKGQA